MFEIVKQPPSCFSISARILTVRERIFLDMTTLIKLTLKLQWVDMGIAFSFWAAVLIKILCFYYYSQHFMAFGLITGVVSNRRERR